MPRPPAANAAPSPPVCAVILAMCSAPASAEPAPTDLPPDVLQRSVPVHQITRTDEAPRIDGLLDERAWAHAAVLDAFLQVEPVEGAAPSQPTEVLLTYDDEHLYIAFRCFDAEPEKIIATQMKRDGSLEADDTVSFLIDTFFDRRNAFYFEINPLGAKGDAYVEDNDRFRKVWDGIWEGKASITDDGWVAEIAIPFKTLSFDPNTTRWGFNAGRFIRRTNESVRWASPSQDKSFRSVADAGVIDGITDIRQGLGLDVKPFLLAAVKRDHDAGRDGLEVDAGFDVFYKFTPSLTLALTVNTDFAETEVDERRINLTRFPLFFPEKRDFFLQDAGIFEFGGIRRNPLPFFSRRIGLGPEGEPKNILAGAKLTGRVGGLNLGFLDVQMKDDPDLGEKNLFVGRASVNVLQESTIGGIFTRGDPRSPDDNYIAGLDFNFRNSTFNHDKTVDGHAWILQSDSTGVDRGQTAYGFKLGYPNDRIDWSAGYSEIGENFNAALGFVPRRAIREYFGDWRYRWRPDDGFVRSVDFGVRGTLITNLENDVESRNLGFELLDLQTQDGDDFNVGFSRLREVLVADFEISDGIVIPAGDYRFDRYDVNFFTSRGRPVSFGLGYGGGQFYSGTRDGYYAAAEWRVSPHLFLGGEYEMDDVDLDAGSFITRIVRGRLNIHFSPDLTWSTFAQYDSVSESIGVNSRVRWIIEPGNEVFFVLNQAIGRDDNSFRVRQTELTTKVGWTFRF